MLIDAHTHLLSLAEDAEFTTEYGCEGSLCIYRSLGKLPAHRTPNEQEWEDSGYSRRGFPLSARPSPSATTPASTRS